MRDGPRHGEEREAAVPRRRSLCLVDLHAQSLVSAPWLAFAPVGPYFNIGHNGHSDVAAECTLHATLVFHDALDGGRVLVDVIVPYLKQDRVVHGAHDLGVSWIKVVAVQLYQ